MSVPALTFDSVVRRFGRTVALDHVDLRLEPGSVLGLVGRNGAGKTTALRLAFGSLWPDAGAIRSLGLDPVKDGLAVRERCSLLSEESSLYPWMTVGEILEFAAGTHPRWDRDLATTLRKRLDLDPRPKVRTLSRGTKAKIALLIAVAPRPELLLLDDPTAGLDPLVRREVLETLMESVAAEGGSVVHATHLVHDVERIADRVVVVDGGRVRLHGAIDEIKARVVRARAVFEGAPPDVAPTGTLDRAVDGRLVTLVAERRNGEPEASLRGAGATGVEIDSLPLEEILVALLRSGGTGGEADV